MRRQDKLHTDPADLFEQNFYCFGSNDDGSEGDGVTFSGEGGGKGINISADNIKVSSDDRKNVDTFRGVSPLDPFVGRGPDVSDILADANRQRSIGGASELQSPAVRNAIAQANARPQATATGIGPRPFARVTATPTTLRNVDQEIASRLDSVGFAPADFQAFVPPPQFKNLGVLTRNPVEMPFSSITNTPSNQNANLANVAADLALGTYDDAPMLAQRNRAITQPSISEIYGGYVDDPDYDADLFGVPRFAEGKKYGLDGELYGADNIGQIGQFIDDAVGSTQFLSDLPLVGNIIGKAIGKDFAEGTRNNVRSMLDAGGQFNADTNRIIADLPKGKLVMNDSGFVTYSGVQDPNYTGPFANLVNPQPEVGAGENDSTPLRRFINPLTGEETNPPADQDKGPITEFPENPDMFVRTTSLDEAPLNVPTGFDFDAANRRFQETFALRPQFYRNPPDLTGFTRLL